MNLFSSLWTRLRNFISPVPQAAMKEAFGVEPMISGKMEESVNLWYALFINQPPWASERVRPLGLPAAVCREIARPVLVEFTADITGGARAEYLMEQFSAAREHFLRDLETGLALGGIAFKPYPFGDRLLVDATGAAGFQPTKFDAAGTCIGGVFRSSPVKAADGSWYVRLEYHSLDGTVYTIRNKAFRSDSAGNVRDEVALKAVPEWADLAPETAVENVEGPLFAYYRNPLSNNIDTASPAGVSVYSGAAADLIRQADEQWAEIAWEYRSGRRKILTDDPGLIGDFDRELFLRVPYSSTEGFCEQFSPEFRDDALYRGFQNILKQLEYQCGLSFGTISDPQTVDKTATEIRSSKQRMYITVDSVQKALTHTFDTLIYAMDVYATLYNLAPAGGYAVAYDWGDSVLDDEETRTARNNDMRLDVSQGLLRPELYVAKKYGVTEEEALGMMPREAEAEPRTGI